MTLGELFLRFFLFYTRVFHPQHHGICIRKGHFSDAFALRNTEKCFQNQRALIIIEDPVDPCDNVARSLSIDTCRQVHDELLRARQILLKSEPDCMQVLMQDIRAEKELARKLRKRKQRSANRKRKGKIDQVQKKCVIETPKVGAEDNATAELISRARALLERYDGRRRSFKNDQRGPEGAISPRNEEEEMVTGFRELNLLKSGNGREQVGKKRFNRHVDAGTGNLVFTTTAREEGRRQGKSKSTKGSQPGNLEAKGEVSEPPTGEESPSKRKRRRGKPRVKNIPQADAQPNNEHFSTDDSLQAPRPNSSRKVQRNGNPGTGQSPDQPQTDATQSKKPKKKNRPRREKRSAVDGQPVMHAKAEMVR